MVNFHKNFIKDPFNLYLTECGVEKNPNFVHQYVVKRQFSIHFISEGEGYYEINQEKHHLKQGDAFILRRDDYVKYYSDNNDQWKYYWISIHGKDLDTILNKTILSQLSIFQFQLDSQFFNIVKKMVSFNQENVDSLPTRLWNNSHTLLFLYQLYLDFIDEEKVNIDYISEEKLTNLIIDYIHNYYNQNILVSDVANHFNISTSYLYNLIHDKYNQTPKEIILDLQLRDAQQLLLYSDLLIKNIASQIGMSSQEYFSKFFKKRTGYSPTEFRKFHK